MANCKKCVFYSDEYDLKKNALEDTIIEGQERKEHHFCIMYDTYIDDYFIHDKECEYEETD